MKKNFGRGLAALLCMSVVGLVGCSESGKVEQEPVQAPYKATPKIIINTETAARDDAKPATPLINAEEGPEGGDSCQSDADCVVIPEPASSCIPCMNNASQRPVSKATARQIMAEHKSRCMPMMQKMQQGGQNMGQRSQNQSCNFNGSKCVQGTCQLGNLSQEEFKRHHGVGQGAPQGGPQSGGYSSGNAPSSSVSFPENFNGNTSSANPWGTNPNTNWNPGANLDNSGYPQNWGRPNYPGADQFKNSPFSRTRFPGMNQFGNNASWSKEGYGSFGNSFGRGNYGSYPGLNSNMANFPGFNGANGFPGAANNNYGSYPGLNPSSSPNYSSFPGMNSNLNGYPGAGSYPGASRGGF